VEAHVTRERLITFLLEAPIFDNLDPAEIMQIMHIVEVQPLQKGDVIFKEGDPGDAWFVLYKGSVDVLKDTPHGENKIATLKPPACFGEMSILDGLPRSAMVRAAEDSVALRITRSAFDGLLDDNELIAYKLIYHMAILLAHRQRATTETLSRLLEDTSVTAIHAGLKVIVGEASVKE
jgi:CRP-like cAMP-binding protein